MSVLLKAGTLSTDVRANGSSKLSVEIFIADATSGQGKTGLTKSSFTKFGLSLVGAAVVDYTSSMVDLSTFGDAYTSKGFKEKDAAKDPGRYRFDIPVADAANVASGSLSWVLSGALDSGDMTGTEMAFVNYDPDVLDPNVAAIKAKTDNLPASPANETTVAAVKTKTDNLPGDPADASDVAAAIASAVSTLGASIAAVLAKTPDSTHYTNAYGDLLTNLSHLDANISAVVTAIGAILTTAMTESYSTDGSNATAAQTLYEIRQILSDFVISGSNILVKKKDGTTTALTLTMNDSTNPTSVTRSS